MADSSTVPMLRGDLHMRGVGVRAGGTRILQDVDLRLRPGELCAIIGPSGAGKSTLMKVLLGIRDPSEGSVDLAGGAVSDAGPVGYVPQDDAVHRSLSVRASLDFAARLRLPALSADARHERIQRVCQQVGLRERLDVKVRRLSGGQRKRVSVAMELLTEPPVLVLDEPTSGLDPGLEARMMALFSELARGGRAVLVSTHAMQSLARCDALLVLVAGRVAWFGTPQDALDYFEVSTWSGIFDRLARHAPPVWGRKWLAHPARSRFLSRSGPAASVGSSSTRPENQPLQAQNSVSDLSGEGGPEGDTGGSGDRPSPEERLAALKAELAAKRGASS